MTKEEFLRSIMPIGKSKYKFSSMFIGDIEYYDCKEEFEKMRHRAIHYGNSIKDKKKFRTHWDSEKKRGTIQRIK